MDLFQTNYGNHKSYTSKLHNKKRLSKDQVRVLERSFSSDKKLEPERKLQLAEQLGISPRQVAVWYQNKRARWRTQSLELDCSALQLRLEIALTEKTELERDLARLRGELDKATQMLLAVHVKDDHKSLRPPTVCSISSFSEDTAAGGGGGGGGGSSLSSFSHNDLYHLMAAHDDDQVLKLDHDLFACFIGTDDSRVVL